MKPCDDHRAGVCVMLSILFLALSASAQTAITPFGQLAPLPANAEPPPDPLIQWIDWDSDGIIDRISIARNLVLIAYGLPSGQLGFAQLAYVGPTGSLIEESTLSDLNFDGRPDLFILQRSSIPSGTFSASILINSASRSVPNRVVVPLHPSIVALSNQTFALTNHPSLPGPAISVQSTSGPLQSVTRQTTLTLAYFNPASNSWVSDLIGTLMPRSPSVGLLPATEGPSGDFDGDGLPDYLLVVAGNCIAASGSVSNLCQHAIAYGLAQAPWFDLSALQFLPPASGNPPAGTTPRGGTASSEVADANNDGIADILILRRLTFISSSPPASVFEVSSLVITHGDRQRTIGMTPVITPLQTHPTTTLQPAFRDLDGDRILDFVYTTDSGTGSPALHFLRGYVDGGFSSPLSAPFPFGIPFALDRAYDVDADGDLDLVDEPNGAPNSGPAVVFRNQTLIGAGSPSISGLIPRSSRSTARLGNPQFALGLESAPPNSPAILGISLGLAPNPGIIGIDLNQILVPIGSFGFTSTDATGSARLGIPLPNQPSLGGTVFYSQWIIATPTSLGFCSTAVGRVILWP